MTEELKCVWILNCPCGGKVKNRKMFRSQITMPVCEKHYKIHRYIYILHQFGYKLEFILKVISLDYYGELVKKIRAAGFNTKKVKA